jgi:hypothetical protein
MAVSHTYHAVAFIILDVYIRGLATPDASPFSTIAYILLFAMTLTSFPLTSKVLFLANICGRLCCTIGNRMGIFSRNGIDGNIAINSVSR